MRQIISHGVVALVCFSLGVLYQGFNEKNTTSAGNESDSAVNLTDSTMASDSENQQKALQNTDSLELDEVDNEEAQSDASDELSAPDALSVVASDNAETPPTSILALLDGTNIEMLQTGEVDLLIAEFTHWFNDSENPGKKIMDFLVTEENSSEEKHVLEFLLGSSTIENLPLSVVQQLALASPEDSEIWENIFYTVSIGSSEARTELLNTLPSITNEKIVSASLLAIKPDFLAPSERTQLLSVMSTYTESENEDVRSAAILSLEQWSAQGYNYVVEDMLANGTDKEKNAALLAASSGKYWSSQIESDVLSTLSDESIRMEIRMNAFNALSSRGLDDQSYAEVHRFYEQHIFPLYAKP